MSLFNPPPLPEKSDASSWEKGLIEKILIDLYKSQQRERTWRHIRRFLWLLLFIVIIGFSFSNSDDLNMDAATEHTAVIDFYGPIMAEFESADRLIMSMEKAYKNPQMKAIIIRANSPGGSPVISDAAFQEIRHLKKQHANIPVYVLVEDICASGCYYMAAAADKIYASSASMVGSIGVIYGSFDLTGLIDKLGIQRRLKTAGRNKGMGDMFSPENAEQNTVWQAMLDDIHQQFIDAVKLGRGNRLQPDPEHAMFSGRVYTANQALPLGLIDGIANINTLSRDIIGIEKQVNYTYKENFTTALSRYMGSEVRQQFSLWVKELQWSVFPE